MATIQAAVPNGEPTVIPGTHLRITQNGPDQPSLLDLIASDGTTRQHFMLPYGLPAVVFCYSNRHTMAAVTGLIEFDFRMTWDSEGAATAWVSDSSDF